MPTASISARPTPPDAGVLASKWILLLSPDVREMILAGQETSGLSLTKLTKDVALG